MRSSFLYIFYSFLLKGHEDLRQDERVMQLFGLVNALLKSGADVDDDTRRLALSIRRYSVTPLSQEAGLVGWVPNCDTLLGLIKVYRESRGKYKYKMRKMERASAIAYMENTCRLRFL